MINSFQNHSEILEEILLLKLIFQTLQQKQMSKIFHTLILQFCTKKIFN